MTTTSSITDIHAAEAEAKKRIEQAQVKNDKTVIETREKEEKKLLELEEKLRKEGKEKFATENKSAAQKADEDLKKNKGNNESEMEVAHNKVDKAIQHGMNAFMEYIKD